ncbi:MAG: rhomboid family intramembrane serine protease [Candidatus Eremiobacteraeota bacterium]|nr:rhomboid family intramembrane serine protease [Candidatus Eremiobacteraeota bacterium]
MTLFTAMFLHASVLHIFFNMLFLLVFGPALSVFAQKFVPLGSFNSIYCESGSLKHKRLPSGS